ncbi:MAG: alpha/beta hydrolase family esterase [Frankia sp.]
MKDRQTGQDKIPGVFAVRPRRFHAAWLASALLLPLALVLSGCGGPTRAAAATRVENRPDAFQTSGRTANLLVHAPPNPSGRPLPLVVALHSLHYDSANAEKVFGLDQLADREGFVVAYPNGIAGSWNAGSCCGSAAANSVDDVAYVRAVISHLEQHYSIDRRRVVLIGLSNGGMLAYRYVCEYPDEIAGIGVVAGSLQVAGCRPSNPVTVVSVHGFTDGLVPYNGLDWSTVLQTPITSVADSLSPFRAVDRCSAPRPTGDSTLTDRSGLPRATDAPPAAPGTTLIFKVETPCLSTARVVDFDLTNTGHGWPPTSGNGSFDAAGVIWRILADARSERTGPDL